MSREKQIDTPTNTPNTPTQNQFTNSEIQQIGEMSLLIHVGLSLQLSYFEIGEYLYNAGYRKQSVGEWLFNRGRTYGEPAYYCSNCSEGGSEYGYDKFCPNCGAKMKGGVPRKAVSEMQTGNTKCFGCNQGYLNCYQTCPNSPVRNNDVPLTQINTPDVVDVVRCKECKYSRERNEHEREYLVEGVLICTSCEASDECWNPVYPSHFCSYGERKE